MPLFRRDDIVIKYGADDSRFQKVSKRVKATGKDVSGFFGDVGKSVQGFFSRTLAGAVTGISVALAAVTKSALSSADALAKTADKVAVNIENLQRLRYAAKASGVEQGTLDMALQRFSRRLAEAAQGTGVLFKEIDRLGIPLRDANGNMRDTTAILLDYADAVKGAESQQERLRLSFVAFDSEGAALVNMLSDGRDGMIDLMAAADELGLVIDENTIRASERLNQKWDEFAQRWSTYWRGTILDMATAMDNLAGNYRTLEDAEKRLLTLNESLAEAERDRANTANFARGIIDLRINKIKEEISELEAKRETLEKIDAIQKRAAAPSATDKPNAGVTTGKGAKGKAKPDLTYDEANLNDFREYRSGKITREEWLQRENERNPYRNPESPYADDMGGTPNYGSVESTLELKPTVSPEFAAEIERAAAAALEGRTYTVKVLPEIVGMESAQAITQTADEEGELR